MAVLNRDGRFALVVVAFMILGALAALEISHGFSQDRGIEPVNDSVFVWLDLPDREPEPVGITFSTRRKPGRLQRAQKKASKGKAGAGQR